MKVLKEETVPFFLSKLNAIAEANDGHLACKKLTWADLYFAALTGVMKFGAIEGEDIWSKYPALRKVVDNVESLDAIKAWIAERPVTEF
jgi:glutathione S-transferase